MAYSGNGPLRAEAYQEAENYFDRYQSEADIPPVCRSMVKDGRAIIEFVRQRGSDELNELIAINNVREYANTCSTRIRLEIAC